MEIDEEKKTIAFDAGLYGNFLQKGFSFLYNNNLFTDVTLLVGKEKLVAHKLVLSTFSPVFKAVFESPEWKDSDKSKEYHVDIKSSEIPLFKALLQYMYTGTASFDESPETLRSLLTMSHQYGVIPLKEAVGKLLGESITLDNIFYLLDIVDTYNTSQLRTMCATFLGNQLPYLLEQDRYMNLHLLNLVELLKQDSLDINLEEDLFELVVQYVTEKCKTKESRDDALNQLLPHIRFPLMTPKYIYEKVEKNKFLQELPNFKNLLMQSYRYIAFDGAECPDLVTRRRKGFIRYDAKLKPSNIELTESGLKMENSSSSWASQFLTCEWAQNTGVKSVTLRIHQTGSIMVGVAAKDAQAMPYLSSQYSGQWRRGWCYYLGSSLYNANQTTAYGNNQNVRNGDLLTLELNTDNGELVYKINGNSLGVAFRNVNCNVWPVISTCSVAPISIEGRIQKKK